jgi:hypothetical protein
LGSNKGLGEQVQRTKWLGIVGVISWFLTCVAVPGPAAAQVQRDQGVPDPAAGKVERRPAIAQFEGRSIDLSKDWGEARACLVWRQGGVVECFRTPQALDAREARLREHGKPPASDGVATASYGWSCSYPLRLFDYSWYGGRQLSFWDRGYWQNLWDYGFDNRTSSYAVGGCYVYLAEYAGGGGWWYSGPNWPWAGEPVLSWGWDNAISSIYIT